MKKQHTSPFFFLFSLTFCCVVVTQISPRLIKAEEAARERDAIDFELRDYRGQTIAMKDFQKSRCVVLAFLGTECPLAKLYAGRLQEISEQYPASEVVVIGVNSNVQDSVTEIDSFVRRHKLTFPMLKDAGNHLADAVGAERLSQVFLLDQDRRIRYQGRIDDQYVVGIVRERPQREDLKIAIRELLENHSVTVKQTKPLGCLIGRVETPNENCPVTYSNQISRIFQDHCVQCHRQGDVAPFTLTSYDDVVGWGPMIAEVVKEQRMPPWHADPHFGSFQNDTSLTAEEKKLIATWVENGCPQGDPSQLPEPKSYVEGWQLPRKPDVVIAMRDQPFDVPADAGPEGIKYQNFWVPTGLTEDRWVVGAEIQPGNRTVVHHILVYAAPDKNKRSGRRVVAAYVPGLRYNPLPPGAAKKIPAGSWLRFEVHYTPVGTPQQDLSKVGLLFADQDQVTHEVRTEFTINTKFVIQPELSNQTFEAKSRRTPVDVDLISLSPHMHLRGQAFEYEAEYPDGTREMLLKVPHYDFNWQTQYRLKEPKRIPAGTVFHCIGTFDNSSHNLANPDPSATVTWGEQTWEEMLIGYMDIMYPVSHTDSGDSSKKTTSTQSKAVRQIDPQAILTRLDKNQDQVISKSEAKPASLLAKYFDKIDHNQDGEVTLDELQKTLEAIR